jgi:ribosome-associated translation inhibitor RaiA
MKISVIDIGCTFGRQTSAYAEYRIFSRLARFDTVHEAEVVLTSARAGGGARCAVVLRVDDGGTLRVSARGRHPYDAINRAVERIGKELRRHTITPPSDSHEVVRAHQDEPGQG